MAKVKMMEESSDSMMANNHLPEALCYCFADRALEIAKKIPIKIDIPDRMRKAMCTPQQCYLCHLYGRYKEASEAIAVEDLPIPATQKSLVDLRTDFRRNHLRCGGIKWREANGVFLTDIAKPKPCITQDLSMKVAKDFSDDQWFFGVIGEIDMRQLTMKPPLDRMLSESAQETLTLSRPTYRLHRPTDVHDSYREILRKEYNRKLPLFKDWVEKNKHHLRERFPKIVSKHCLETPEKTQPIPKNAKQVAVQPKRRRNVAATPATAPTIAGTVNTPILVVDDEENRTPVCSNLAHPKKENSFHEFPNASSQPNLPKRKLNSHEATPTAKRHHAKTDKQSSLMPHGMPEAGIHQIPNGAEIPIRANGLNSTVESPEAHRKSIANAFNETGSHEHAVSQPQLPPALRQPGFNIARDPSAVSDLEFDHMGTLMQTQTVFPDGCERTYALGDYELTITLNKKAIQ